GAGAAATATAGTYTGSITPSAATGGTFNASNYTISYATGDLIIDKAAITIMANTVHKTYGQTLTTTTGSTAYTITSGTLQNAETIGSVTITYGTGAAATATAGTYTGSITPSAATGGTFSASNYTISYATGDLIIDKAAITIMANTVHKTYGQTLTTTTGSTAYTITSGTLQNAETIGSVTITYGTGAAATATAGTYTGSITPSAATGGTFNASNYTISYATGDLIIDKAAITITANTVHKTYGQTLTTTAGSTAYTITSGTLQNAETIGSITIAYGAGAAATATAGTYTGSITPSAATGGTFNASNYTISYATGDLIVDKAAITITANTIHKTYGQTLTTTTGSTAYTITSGTLQNSETIGSITIAYGAGAAATATAGTYTGSITPSAATGGTFNASNYTISYATGDLIVDKAAITITANTVHKTYGQTLTTTTGSTAYTITSGTLQNSETIGSITIAYGAGAAATATAGTYTGSITPSAATGGTFNASNYTISYATGDLI
ncbi:MBG domain-containing protein, partial [Mucilaginibacter panaciglaebae]|uniref:MBG domain-containing protein n=1 Tax=Mucilaginibacter panaciglaebae TaxID=502331 RepID=UPI0031EF815F